jgi:predicted GNAT superfamily acetyltransferase
MNEIEDENSRPNLSLFEIPPDFQALKTEDMQLAVSWRMYTRAIFELYFYNGYIVTDFVYQPGESPRSFYVLSHGDAQLGLGG